MLGRLSIVAVLVAALPTGGSAGFVTFTDRAAWQAAAGTPTATEDFQGFTQAAPIFPVPLTANGFTVTANRRVPLVNLVDVLPFGSPLSAANSPNGTNFLLLGVDTTRTVTLTFTGDVTAFGADLRGADKLGQQVIDVYGTGNVLLGTIDPTSNSTQFNGFVLTGGERAERLLFRSSVNPGDGAIYSFGIDNVALVVPTPVPPGLVIATLGLPALALAHRLRRTRRRA